MAINLAPLFQSFGDVGTSVARARLGAAQYRIQQMLDQLGIRREEQALKRGATEEEEAEERLRRLKLEPETEQQAQEQKFATFESLLKRKLTDREKLILSGFPYQALTNPLQKKIEDAEEALGRKLTPQERNVFVGLESKEPIQKPIQRPNYDTHGQLRWSTVDPATQEITSWGQPVAAKDAFQRITDQVTGDVTIVRMPAYQKVDPGTIRMTPEAEKQLENFYQGLPGAKKPPTSSTEKPRVEGTFRTTPKALGQEAVVALKDAQGKYSIWLRAAKNAQFRTPRTDLAIVFDAVRTAVAGAGRMTNVELDRELKAGSFPDRFRRQAKMALEGTLPDDQREDLLRTIRNSWSASAQTARSAWKDAYRDRAMPAYIQGQDVSTPEGQTGPPPAPPVPGAVVRQKP